MIFHSLPFGITQIFLYVHFAFILKESYYPQETG